MPPKHSRSPEGYSEGQAFVNGDEFTRVVRKRLSTSTRTGQACDRCKVRKIRCDGLPGGCSPCIQNRTECKTTDRISQKAVPRGYLESLEQKVLHLEQKNRELNNSLLAAQASAASRNIGFAFDNQDWMTNNSPAAGKQDPRLQNNAFANREYQAMTEPQIHTEKAVPRTTSFRPGDSSTHYLGISGNTYLSSMKETALNMLGVNIDLTSLDPTESVPSGGSTRLDETYGSCLATIFNINPNIPKPELPPRSEGMNHIHYFLTISHPYLPILHKPTFLDMCERIYSDPKFQPTAAQTVMIHMVFAIVNFQIAASDRMKNNGKHTAQSAEINELSRRHYHYAISLIYHLLTDSSLEDLQAIGLILQHLRAFPKPGGSWLLSRMAVSMCLERGLHRSVKKWSYNRRDTNHIEIELRKRVFWCIITLEVSLASRLGRPMSIRDGDFDVEYPERVDDQFITEKEIIRTEDGVEACEFDVAIEMFKHTSLTIQIHSTLYGVTRPSRDQYVNLVADMENKLQIWRDNHPKSLSLDSPNPARRFQAAHLHSWYHESRILMRHPSLDGSPSPSFTDDSVKICVSSAREILRLTDNLRKGKHYLDTTWYGATVQLLATITILFSIWHDREKVSNEEIDRVQKDMELATDIMRDLGALLGCPNKLADIVQLLTFKTMNLVSRPGLTTKKSPSSSLTSSSPFSQQHEARNQTPQQTNPYPPVTVSSAAKLSNPLAEFTYDRYPDASNDSSVNVFEAGAAAAAAGGGIGTNSLGASSGIGASSVGAAMTAGAGGMPSSPLATSTASGMTGSALYAPAYSPTSYPPSNSDHNIFPWGWNGNESWRQYTQSISVENLDPSESYASSALIALNQDCQNYGSAGMGGVGAEMGVGDVNGTAAQQAQQGLGLLNNGQVQGVSGVQGNGVGGSVNSGTYGGQEGQWPGMGGYAYPTERIAGEGGQTGSS
ncbi:fungal-specific transcription factor domain-containing protein [Pyronema omphalodes]|nr:fungal-specific transcription factor domain-containing protein [Pyronema omphalodes]